MMTGLPQFADMFIEPDQDPRTEPPTQAGERATLAGFLRWQRETLELKCAGVDPESLSRRRSVKIWLPPWIAVTTISALASCAIDCPATAYPVVTAHPVPVPRSSLPGCQARGDDNSPLINADSVVREVHVPVLLGVLE
jgi:hypothetical protein